MTRTLCSAVLAIVLATAGTATAQDAPLPPLPSALGIPRPGPVTDAPYAPQPILQGGIVVPLYPPGSPFLKADRVREAKVYSVSQTVPGGIPMGTWQYRFIDWFRDLGFLQRPGVETKAAKDIATFVSQEPPRTRN
jgi:hypothetical protein